MGAIVRKYARSLAQIVVNMIGAWRRQVYGLLTSGLSPTFDDKLSKIVGDTIKDENIVDFVCNRPP